MKGVGHRSSPLGHTSHLSMHHSSSHAHHTCQQHRDGGAHTVHAARPGHLVVRVGGRGPQRVEYALQPVTADLCVQGPMPQQSDPAAGKQGWLGRLGCHLVWSNRWGDKSGVMLHSGWAGWGAAWCGQTDGGQVRCDAAWWLGRLGATWCDRTAETMQPSHAIRGDGLPVKHADTDLYGHPHL